MKARLLVLTLVLTNNAFAGMKNGKATADGTFKVMQSAAYIECMDGPNAPLAENPTAYCLKLAIHEECSRELDVTMHAAYKECMGKIENNETYCSTKIRIHICNDIYAGSK